MPTNLQYAGVQLTNVQTLEFAQSPQRDASGTDQIAQKFAIKVRSFVNSATYNGYVPGGGAATPIGATVGPTVAAPTAQRVEVAIRAALMQDRQSFSYTMEGIVMVAADATTDCNNGPKVIGLDVVRVNPLTLRIDFAIEVWLIQCPQFTSSPGNPAPPGNPNPPAISNRWACIDDVDDIFRTTRIWQGVLRIANSGSSGNSVQFSPQSFRPIVTPPLFAGWKRKSMHFRGDPDTLTLAYAIIDEEMIGPAPPWPAARMKFSHVESCGAGSTEGGAAGALNCVGHVQVAMEGSRGADKRIMIARATQIIEQKLQLNKPQMSFVLAELTIADHQGPDLNAIEMQCKVLHCAIPGQSTSAFLATAVMDQMGLPLALPNVDPGDRATAPANQGNQGNTGAGGSQGPSAPNANQSAIANYNPDQAYVLGPFGTATLATLYACFLQTPCGNNHAMPQDAASGVSPTAYPPTYGGANETPAVTYSTGAVSYSTALSTPPSFSPGDQAMIYQHYQIDSTFRKKYNRAACPIAAQASSGDSSSGSSGGAASPTVAIVTLANPLCMRTVRVKGERKGDWPSMPQDVDFTDSTGIRNFIMESHKLGHSRAPTPDGGGYDYCQEIEYEFQLESPPGADAALPVGILPWDGNAGSGSSGSSGGTPAISASSFISPNDPNYGIA